MTNILYYNWTHFLDNNKAGGVGVYQKNIIDELKKCKNYKIFYLTSGDLYNPFSNKIYIKKSKNKYNGVKCFDLVNSPVIAPMYYSYNKLENYINCKEKEKLIKIFVDFCNNNKINVIHFNNLEGLPISILEIKKYLPNLKLIFSIHNYQLFCPLVQLFQNHTYKNCLNFDNGNECCKCAVIKPNYKMFREKVLNFFNPCKHSLFARFICFLLKKSLIKRAKYVMSYNYQQNNGSIFNLYRKINVDYINKYVDIVFSVSQRVKDIATKFGIDPSKNIVSFIGTKFAENELKHSIATKVKPFTIVYLGYARIDKGYFFMLDALSKLDKELARKINVVLAVKNISKNFEKQKLKNFNDVICYDGYNHNQLFNILKNVNLGIVPVLWEDNLPQVAIEMVACGVPILCSSFGGASELSNSNLFKFKGANEEDFINKLINLVNNPNLLNEYWKYHENLKTMKDHFEELLKIYD